MTGFLLGFSCSVVARLHREEQLLLTDGATEAEVAEFVAEFLASRKPCSSLISSLSAALVACPKVEELFVGDDELKAVVDDVPPEELPH